MIVARDRGMSVTEAMNKLPLSEFRDALQLMTEELHEHEKIDWLFARLTWSVDLLRHRVENILNKNPPKFEKEVKDCLITFTEKAAETPAVNQVVDGELVEADEYEEAMQFQAKLRAQKTAVFAWLGLTEDGTRDESQKLVKKLPGA